MTGIGKLSLLFTIWTQCSFTTSYSLHVTPPKPMRTNGYWKAFLNISYLDPENKIWHTERAETGRYSVGNTADIKGVAVVMTSYDPFKTDGEVSELDKYTGCQPPFETNYPTNEPWVAVIQRGKCTFNQKIQNAIQLNASAVLIYDNEPTNKVLQEMVVEKHPIPSVFTYNWKGLEIVNRTLEFGRVVLRMHKGSRCQTAFEGMYTCNPPDEWEDFENLLKNHGSGHWNWTITGMRNGVYNVEKRTSVLFVSVSFMILMLISLAWLVFYYIQRFRYIHAKDQLERKLCCQAKRALAIISTNEVKKDDFDKKDFEDTCAVCIETYHIADVVRILPCKHQFHKTCIDQWLLEKRTCPMCKMDILKHYGLITEDTTNSTGSMESTYMA